MVYLEKSQPAPACLAVEKAKANGDYKCGDVLGDEMARFHELLARYGNVDEDAEKRVLTGEIKEHLNSASGFTAFKRWAIGDGSKFGLRLATPGNPGPVPITPGNRGEAQ
uniref:Uncharacterized protein n=1 Tax=Candidatus Kentrum sp. FW TaxID=2126338 RepID=A0A450TX15_9GAMM|nr:MAG: hypothetical protein BECKFW1821C_GA0114237_105211 [Candidatus Kentron sp. FW]